MISSTTLFQEDDDTMDSLLCLHLAVELLNRHSSVILWSLQQLITPHTDTVQYLLCMCKNLMEYLT